MLFTVKDNVVWYGKISARGGGDEMSIRFEAEMKTLPDIRDNFSRQMFTSPRQIRFFQTN